ncbi:DUF1236 domain-containing protein [Sinorhizobium medicae]|nr:DUF1236 domain-containing protein [Sinorhizobium medicae]MDX0728615.1 DUF1236 domain-containing protein [Sinorhizobium medicae]MDX0734869.1 DUF1236 domain-containing protein [Sinorhizobium medicae]MDX0814772.1 DUF1236 domain-containing protein [Sinorhizobium medicae]MDX1100998.1 DUF1236 domain-containing protein [Sinorhizobium medicae]
MTVFLVKSSVALSLAVFLTAAPAEAQSTIEIGAAETAAVAIAGPDAGATIDPPPKGVIEYVELQPLPQRPLVFQEQIAVGKPVPETVFLNTVPADRRYGFAVVNKKRVIADVKSRTVVQLVQ